MAEGDKYWQQLAYAEQLLSEARCRDDKQAEGDAAIFLGRSCAALGLMTEAVNAFEQGMPVYREFHSQVEIGYVLMQLGSSLYQIECFGRAFIALEEALALAKQTSFGRLHLDCLSWLGLASLEEGKLQKAILCHQEALAIIRINSDREAEMHALGNLGGAYAKFGRSHEAIACHESSLLIAYELGNVVSQALELGNIGCTYTEAFEMPAIGICYLEQALSLFCTARDQYNEAKTLANIGGAYWQAKRSRLALRFLDQAKSIATEQGDRGLLGSILSKIGNIYSALGRRDDAFRTYQQALLLDQGRGDGRAEGQHLNSLGLLQQADGHPEEALQLYRKALVLARGRKNLLEEARQFRNIAGALTLSGKPEEGLLHNKHAMTLFQELRDTIGEGRTYVSIGMAYINTKIVSSATGLKGNKGKALAYWRMGQLLLKTTYRTENEEIQQKIDSLKGIVHEKTFQRWWSSSENHMRWLIFQRHWINKEIFVIGNKNNDLLFYSRDFEGEDFFIYNSWPCELAWRQGDSAVREENWQDALVYYQDALTIESQQGKPDTQALLLGNLGCSYAKVRKFEEGIACLQRSLDLFRFLDDTNNVIKTLLNLGTLQVQARLIVEAREYFDMALRLTDMFENRLFESIALRKMSEVDSFYNKIYDAKFFLNCALEIANTHGDKQEEGKLLTSSGFICMELGQTHKAISHFQRARDLYQKVHDSKSEGEQWCSLAIAYAVQGKFNAAQENFLQAQKIFRYHGYKLGESQINVYMGVLSFFKGNLPLLIAYLRRALDLAAYDAHAQEQIKHMQEQIVKAIDREIYQQAWSKSTQYYQSLC
jgi:tetratricopeptide (TPR) repeat protein